VAYYAWNIATFLLPVGSLPNRDAVRIGSTFTMEAMSE
jgi:hypothetical protein